MNNSNNSRFDDWTDVNCNDCSRYWDSSCDGIPEGSKKLCNSFMATRNVIIPKQIEELQKSIKWLEWSIVLISFGCLCMLVGYFI